MMDSNPIFSILTNIIIRQNRQLLIELAKKYELDEEYMLQKYLQPAYYLPVIVSTRPKPPSTS
jgi:hypothetical protein